MLIANLGRNALRDREVMHGDLPSLPAASREGGEETVRDGGLFENRISTAYAVRNNGGSGGRISANATSGRRRHHAIAAVVFCAVERGVGALEHVGDRLAFQLQRR